MAAERNALDGPTTFAEVNLLLSPPDYEEALFWFALAVNTGDDSAAEGYNRVAAKLTPEQIAEVSARVDRWFPK